MSSQPVSAVQERFFYNPMNSLMSSPRKSSSASEQFAPDSNRSDQQTFLAIKSNIHQKDTIPEVDEGGKKKVFITPTPVPEEAKPKQKIFGGVSQQDTNINFLQEQKVNHTLFKKVAKMAQTKANVGDSQASFVEQDFEIVTKPQYVSFQKMFFNTRFTTEGLLYYVDMYRGIKAVCEEFITFIIKINQFREDVNTKYEKYYTHAKNMQELIISESTNFSRKFYVRETSQNITLFCDDLTQMGILQKLVQDPWNIPKNKYEDAKSILDLRIKLTGTTQLAPFEKTYGQLKNETENIIKDATTADTLLNSAAQRINSLGQDQNFQKQFQLLLGRYKVATTFVKFNLSQQTTELCFIVKLESKLIIDHLSPEFNPEDPNSLISFYHHIGISKTKIDRFLHLQDRYMTDVTKKFNQMISLIKSLDIDLTKSTSQSQSERINKTMEKAIEMAQIIKTQDITEIDAMLMDIEGIKQNPYLQNVISKVKKNIHNQMKRLNELVKEMIHSLESIGSMDQTDQSTYITTLVERVQELNL